MDSRPRKTTLEIFNEELAVLDRPLEGDVEYIDERPRQRQRGGISAIIIGSVFFAGAGVLFFSHPDPETIIAAAQAAAARAPQPPPTTAAPTVVESPVANPAVATVPSGTAAAEAEPDADADADAEMDTANAPPKWRSPPPRAAWVKLSGAARARHR